MANQYTYIPINKEKIIEVYINSNRSMKEASIILGCSIKKLWKDLQFYKIQAKSKGGKGKPKINRHSPDRIEYMKWRDANNVLREKYGFVPRYPEEKIRIMFETPGFTSKKAAEELSCGYRYVERLLVTYGLVEPYKKRGGTHVYPILKNKRWLLKQTKTKSFREIAKEVGCSYSAVMSTANKFNIHPEMKYNRVRKGNQAPRWAGGKRTASSGGKYVYVHNPEHPKATKAGYVMEHRLIAEEKLGRIIEDHEEIHHINGDKKDNRPENLEVCTRKEHSKIHFDAVKKVSVLQEEIKHLKKILDENNISH